MSNFEVEHQDPLCYKGTYVLINKLGIKDYHELQKVERLKTTLRQAELVLSPIKGNYDLEHLNKIHGYLFQDLYDWAGQVRNFYLSKGGSPFCKPEHINSYANEIFNNLKKDNCYQNLNKDEFADKMGTTWGSINALHPYREGNGRNAREFLRELALNANYELSLNNIDPAYVIYASRESINGNDQLLKRIIKNNIVSLEKNKSLDKDLDCDIDMGF